MDELEWLKIRKRELIREQLAETNPRTKAMIRGEKINIQNRINRLEGKPIHKQKRKGKVK